MRLASKEGRLQQPGPLVKFSYGGLQPHQQIVERSNSTQQQQPIRIQSVGASPIIHRREPSRHPILVQEQQSQQPAQQQEQVRAVIRIPLNSSAQQLCGPSSQPVSQGRPMATLNLTQSDNQSSNSSRSPQQSPRGDQQRQIVSENREVAPAAKLLRKQRIIVIDQSDHKLELEVLRLKYKALEQKSNSLEQKCNQLEQQMQENGSMRLPSHIHEQGIEEDMNEELPSTDRLEDVVASRIEQQLEQLKAEYSNRQLQIISQYREEEANLNRQNSLLAEELKRKDGRILELEGALAKQHEEALMSPRSNQQDKSTRLGSTMARQQSTTSLQNNLELISQKARVEQLTIELQSKSSHITQLTSKFQQQLRLQRLRFQEQLQSGKNMHQQETASLRSRLEELEAAQQNEQRQQRQRHQATVEQYQHQLLQSNHQLSMREQLLTKLQADEQFLHRNIARNAEQLRRLQSESETKHNSLAEQLKASKAQEEKLKETIRKLSEQNRSLSFSDQEKEGKLASVTEEVSRLRMMVEETRKEAAEEIKQSEAQLNASKKRIIEMEGEISKLKLELQRLKGSQVVLPMQQENAPHSPRSNDQLCQLLERKNQELDRKRMEYESNLRRLRQQCEDSYRETLEMHQDKIQELERKLLRRRQDEKLAHKRTHTADSSLKRVVSEKLFHKLENNSSSMFEEMQHHVQEFQLKIDKVVEGCKAEFSTRGQSYLRELKTLTLGLCARIEYCRNQNTRMKLKAEDECVVRREDQRKPSGESKNARTLQMLENELSKCKKAMAEYEVLLYQAQLAKQYAPKPANQDEFGERLAMLQEKVDFYKEKNTEMEKRTNSLLQLNSTLKLQLEEATRSPLGHPSAEQIQRQIHNQQAASRSQEKIREMSDEIMRVKSEHLFKLQSCEREWQNKLNQQEQMVVELNVKMATLKNELAVSDNELKLHRDTLQHRQGLLAQSTNKIAILRKELNELSQERRKRQEAESTLAETASRLSSLQKQRDNLEAENSGMKKHTTYLEKQLLTSNEKSSNLSSTNITIDLELTQARTAALFHERRSQELMQEVKTLQRYRVECDTAANDDRHRINQLEVKLRDSYYELEKANKLRQANESELSMIKSSYSTQKEQLQKLGQAKRELESELGKLKSQSKALSTSRSESSNGLIQEYEQRLVSLTQQLHLVKERLAQALIQTAETEKLLDWNAQLQDHLAVLEKQLVALSQHNHGLQDALQQLQLEKQSFESQARAKILQLQETLNSHNSSSTEREQYEAAQEQSREQLAHRIQFLEEKMSEITDTYEARFDLVNREFQERYFELESHYRSQLVTQKGTSLVGSQELFVEVLSSVTQFCGMGFLLERIRSNCANSLVMLEEVQLRNEQAVPPLEQLVGANHDSLQSIQKLIESYNAVQRHN